VVAGSGTEAIAAVDAAVQSRQNFDFALVDTRLSGVEAFALTAELQQRAGWELPAIVIFDSGHRAHDVMMAARSGIRAQLTKPVWKADLEKAILQALGREQAHAAAGLLEPGGAEEAESMRRLKILLAEDNLINQKLTTRLLERQGHEVVVAGNGREALDAMMERHFDAVLMDVQMPEMDGIEATRLIRQQEAGRGERRVIIAITAHAFADDRAKCLEAGMDEYISKPFEIAELSALLKRVTSQTQISA
jgi:CheY-like chemotaxis protein